MKKSNLILYLILLFSLARIIPDILNPNKGFIYVIEEVTFGVIFIIGWFLFDKRVEKSVEQLESQYSWGRDFTKRLLANLVKYFSYVLIVGGIFALLSSLYLTNFGYPDWYHNILREKALNNGFHIPRKHPRLHFIISDSFAFTSLLFLILFLKEEIYLYSGRTARQRLNYQKMQKEQALLKANVLKKQLNPHFMFNTLNVLSGLIHEDVNKADKFIKEFSEVYRYVLEQSEEALSTLGQEIKFIESYFYLLQIRFEEKLEYDIRIPEENLNSKIPSLTLELLVENAVKHNIVSEKAPLKIEIFTQNNKLIVKNNLQLRENDVPSTQKGINNLQERLSLLGIHDAKFDIKDESYIASIPLLGA